jgi:hypothetical protein
MRTIAKVQKAVEAVLVTTRFGVILGGCSLGIYIGAPDVYRTGCSYRLVDKMPLTMHGRSLKEEGAANFLASWSVLSC